MKLRDIIDRIDRSKRSDPVDGYGIASELGVSVDLAEVDLEDHGVSKYRYASWICTDTRVGGSIIFLDGEPVAATWQSARKDDERYWWFSAEAAAKMRQRLLDIQIKTAPPAVKLVDLDMDMSDGFHVSFSSQLLTDDVIWRGRPAKVVKVYGTRYERPVEHWSTVDLEQDGVVTPNVPMEDVLVPYCLQEAPDA